MRFFRDESGSAMVETMAILMLGAFVTTFAMGTAQPALERIAQATGAVPAAVAAEE